MMLRSAASPGSVGWAGRPWRKVASSDRCQTAGRPPLSFCSDNVHGQPGVHAGMPCALTKNAAQGGVFVTVRSPPYLIFVSLNSTCFLAIGSYLRKESLSVLVRLFLLVT